MSEPRADPLDTGCPVPLDAIARAPRFARGAVKCAVAASLARWANGLSRGAAGHTEPVDTVSVTVLS